MPSRVEIGARLHFGFLNLALSRTRLYGGVGLALAEPRTVLSAAPAEAVVCDDETAAHYARQVVECLDVPGARISIERAIPNHVGLGSGTRLALGSLLAVADVYDRGPRVRELAPALGRGGRSGVGVATAEHGGFVVDAGHPTSMFTPDRPEHGQWEVPAVTVRHDIPEDWRFVLVIPEARTGRSGEAEDGAMRSVVESADPSIADDIATALVDRVLPGVATGDVTTFGSGAMTIDRANGEWYADIQGGVYRPPAGQIVERLRSAETAAGVGQSSWGPTVWAVTDTHGADRLAARARDTLTQMGLDGRVHVTQGLNEGARARNV
jgi:beta-ribofuranosylaminobenzene 5'-phosphate synthase